MEMKLSESSWISPNGKIIPFKRESLFLITDDLNDYYLQITKWTKNTSVEICVIYYDCTDCAFDEQYLDETVYRIAKVPHAEFDSQRENLIRKAVNFVEELTGLSVEI